MAAVWRAYTTHVTARNVTSHPAIQWRPLSLTGHLEGAELCRAAAEIRAELHGVGAERPLREHAPQRAPAARAHGLPRRADAGAAPIAEGVLDDAILARVISDHRDAAAGDERGAQRRQRELELFELLVDHDPERLEQAREVGRPGACTPHLANRVHEIVARREGRAAPAPHDHPAELPRARLVGELPERLREALRGPGVEDVGGGHAPPRRHAHVERRRRTKGKPAGVRIELVGRDAQVQQDAVGAERLDGAEHLGRAERADGVADPLLTESRARGGERLRVAVDGDVGALPIPSPGAKRKPRLPWQTGPDASSREAGSGGADGARTRDLRCDRPAL